VLIIIAIVLIADNQAESAPTVSTQSYTPTDSASQDSLSSEKVNLARLKSRVEASPNQPVDTTNLDSQITSIINANMDVVIGVSIKDLSTGSIHNYGNPGAMTAASVTKVLTAVDYMKEVELGHKSLDTVMSNGHTAQSNIEQMIVVSDNDAWHILNDSLTYTQLQAYAESIGLSSYYYGDNVISAADTTKLLGDMYQRKLIDESHTQLLLSYMERANYRDLIIPAVPTTDTVYHKAGEYLVNLNDAAIITNSQETIVLSIFTESLYSYDKPRVSAIMQQITAPTLQTFQLN